MFLMNSIKNCLGKVLRNESLRNNGARILITILELEEIWDKAERRLFNKIIRLIRKGRDEEAIRLLEDFRDRKDDRT
jgi:hypothetical protein